MLTGLRHRAISSRNDEDTAVHLCRTSDHVFNIVSVARAVDVCVVTVLGLILNVRGRDRDTTSFLFRCFVDVAVVLERTTTGFCQNFGDCCGQRGFTVVNVADGANVNVRFCTLKLFLGHCPQILLSEPKKHVETHRTSRRVAS